MRLLLTSEGRCAQEAEHFILFFAKKQLGFVCLFAFFFWLFFLPKYDCMLVLFPNFLTDLTISKSILVSHASCG